MDGNDVWVDLGSLIRAVPVVSNATGGVSLPLPVPGNPALVGLQFCAQFGWVDPSAPPPCPPLGV